MKEIVKKNLVITVAIVWQKGNEQRLLMSVYSEGKDNIKNYDEALGKAIIDQRKILVDPERYTMILDSSSSSWQVDDKPDLSCLRYC